jgi:hypothetical protein
MTFSEVTQIHAIKHPTYLTNVDKHVQKPGASAFQMLLLELNHTANLTALFVYSVRCISVNITWYSEHGKSHFT